MHGTANAGKARENTVKAADRAKAPPGHVPLGNLFDDRAGTSLESAIGSDRFKSVATADSLGVDRVSAGWGNVAQISPGVRFHFIHLGSSGDKHGQIVNDGWNTDGGIRTGGDVCKAIVSGADAVMIGRP